VPLGDSFYDPVYAAAERCGATLGIFSYDNVKRLNCKHQIFSGGLFELRRLFRQLKENSDLENISALLAVMI
jgi:hypothetical protein